MEQDLHILRVDWGSKCCYASIMQITVELPDDLAQQPDAGRKALENCS